MNIKNLLTCLHRHTVDEHPACFYEGAVVDRREDKSIPWFQQEGTRIGYLDIEADGLKPDWATMLTWCIKEKGNDNIVFDVVNRKDLLSGVTDQKIIESAIETMRKFDIIVTYYGTGYDIPFLRAKAMRYDLDFPGYVWDGKKLVPEIYHFDLYYTVKSKMHLSRNSLDNATDWLGIPGKTHIEKDAWRAAKYGDPDGLNEVLNHNKFDVDILEKLHDKLTKFNKWTKRGV